MVIAACTPSKMRIILTLSSIRVSICKQVAKSGYWHFDIHTGLDLDSFHSHILEGYRSKPLMTRQNRFRIVVVMNKILPDQNKAIASFQYVHTLSFRIRNLLHKFFYYFPGVQQHAPAVRGDIYPTDSLLVACVQICSNLPNLSHASTLTITDFS
jgi:hypothetical protein